MSIAARTWRLAAAASASVLLLAACGGTSQSGAAGAANRSPLAEAQCMRSHGVSNFPDPTQGPGGEGFSTVRSPGSAAVTINGVRFDGPAFVSAARRCGVLGAGNGPSPVTEAQKEALFAKARCLRTHGVPGFPDPIIGPGGYGIGIPIPPDLSMDSPAFRQAAKDCRGVGASIPHVPS
jgi:hypothetical protein